MATSLAGLPRNWVVAGGSSWLSSCVLWSWRVGYVKRELQCCKKQVIFATHLQLRLQNGLQARYYVKKAVTTENVVVSFGGIFYVLNSSVHLQPRLQNRDNYEIYSTDIIER